MIFTNTVFSGSVFRWINCFYDLADDKVVSIIHYFIIFYSKVSLINMYDAILRVIVLLHVEVSWLLVKIDVMLPNAT